MPLPPVLDRFLQAQEPVWPRVIAELDDSYIKVAKVLGSLAWHSHDHEDEMFWVLKGHLRIEMETGVAELSVEAHPHMLRHACGYALADQGADTRLIQDYLGHRNIQHTVRYTATNPARFERLWR